MTLALDLNGTHRNGRSEVKRPGDRRKLKKRTFERRKKDRRKDWQGEVEFQDWKDKGRRKSDGERRKADRRVSDRRIGLRDRRVALPRPGRSADVGTLTILKGAQIDEAAIEGTGRVASLNTGTSEPSAKPKKMYDRRVPLGIPKTPADVQRPESLSVQIRQFFGDWSRRFKHVMLNSDRKEG